MISIPSRTIALVAPELTTFEEARNVAKKFSEPIILALGLQEKGVAETAKLLQRGVEVIISRGETARMIKTAFPDLTVVVIQRSGLDIARALGRAQGYGGKIAAVAFPDTLERVVAVCEGLSIPITPYRIDSRAEAEDAVLRAVNHGAKVVVGVASSVAAARKLGVPCELVRSGEESLTEAVEKARDIMEARRMDKAKMSLLRTVIDATDEGIVAVDGAGGITVFNALAERYTGHDAREVIGRNIGKVWPELGMPQVLKEGRAEPNILVKVRDRTLVCNITPVWVDAVASGAVCTFHDAGRIQAMEASVRRKLHEAGHVAGTRFQDMHGKSRVLKQAITTAKEYARSEDTVLLAGETGTGKELFAQSVHNYSPRNKGPFVAVNCAALPGHLLESELFGYVAGAFTGASSKGKTGLFELAHGGTIFLDEVTEMELGVQAKLLRVLQERKVMRLGSDQVVPVDVRIIASTNKDLDELPNSGGFRRDLYYRLNVLLLYLPALRDRVEDIPCLCKHFLKGKRSGEGTGPVFTPEAWTVLRSHSWPGNVRELQNVMARVSAMGVETVSARHLRSLLGAAQTRKVESIFERDRVDDIRKVLRDVNGRKGEAARRLGMSRSTLWRKMREIGL